MIAVSARLVDLHRFVNEWEKAASLDLRHGRPEAIDAYLAHDRVQSGGGEDTPEAAYQAGRIHRFTTTQ